MMKQPTVNTALTLMTKSKFIFVDINRRKHCFSEVTMAHNNFHSTTSISLHVRLQTFFEPIQEKPVVELVIRLIASFRFIYTELQAALCKYNRALTNALSSVSTVLNIKNGYQVYFLIAASIRFAYIHGLYIYTDLAKKNCTSRQSAITFFCIEITI